MTTFNEALKRDRIRWTFRLQCSQLSRAGAIRHCATLFGRTPLEIEEIVKEQKC